MATYQSKNHTFAICAYKESPYLEECINSILEQNAKSNVLISTSTPNNFISELAARYEIPLFVNDTEPSISSDWNNALGHVTTPLATIAHQDDIYLPEYSETLIRLFNEASSPIIFFTDYGELRSTGVIDNNRILKVKRSLLSPLRRKANWSNKVIRRRILSLGSSICCPSVAYNLERIERPIFDNVFKCDLDWQAWERLSKMDGSFVYVDKILMRHRIHEESETTALIEDDTRSKEDLAMFECFWPKPVAKIIMHFYASSQKSNNN